MTIVFDSNLAGAATHALVIGVGAYPNAKPGAGGPPVLQSVEDLQSAANGAKLTVDWLIEHATDFSPPLGTVDVLIADPQDGPAYAWANAPGAPVQLPTTATVVDAGGAWIERCGAHPGSGALMFVTGHGAVHGNDPVVFLTDLNANVKDRWSYLNVRETAGALKRIDNIEWALLLVDACQEFIVEFETAKPGIGARFTEDPDPMADPGQQKVALLSAAAQKVLTYEGELTTQVGVNAGRFTQTVLRALDGASARDQSGSGQWVNYAGAVFEDLVYLYRLRPEWREKGFDPSQPEQQNLILPIMSYAAPPDVPILVRTDPVEALKAFDLNIFDQGKSPPALRSCPPTDQGEWITSLPVSWAQHWLVAHAGGAPLEKAFVPARSIYNQVLKVQT
ncbi:hypothetical protein [Phenylobacterium sp.]|uniref:hypothetical protein n=1 Tax=Phenylobacterium sp. TaxID=1871053 RepID=UPI0035616A70